MIVMIKKSKMKYLYNDEKLNVKEVYSQNKTQRSVRLVSLPVTIKKDGESLPTNFVYFCNKSDQKDWLVIISINLELSEEESVCVLEYVGTLSFFKT